MTRPVVAGAVGLALCTAVAVASSPLHAAATTDSATATPIKHVVVFFQENHSFDETLGAFCQAHPGRCNGYVGRVTLQDGTVVDMHNSPDVVPDVTHTVADQVAAIDKGKMDGWAKVGNCQAEDGYPCLSYYTPAQIPNLAALANTFTIADRMFTMADSPSWGGHLAIAAASLDGFTGDNPQPRLAGIGWGCNTRKLETWISPAGVASKQPSCIPAPPGFLDPKKYPYNGAFEPTQVVNVPTIFDRLDTAGLSWKIYGDVPSWEICPSFAECVYGPQAANLVTPLSILSDAKNGTLPSYSVLTARNATSQHNDTSMIEGDNWIGQVMAALQASPEWSSTAVFITYDDCGCFYDHVAPGLNPDGTPQGLRIPTVIASPYARPGFTDSNPATFASILRFTEETFGLPPLSANDFGAYDFAAAFNYSQKVGPLAVLRDHPVAPSSGNLPPISENDPT